MYFDLIKCNLYFKVYEIGQNLSKYIDFLQCIIRSENIESVYRSIDTHYKYKFDDVLDHVCLRCLR